MCSHRDYSQLKTRDQTQSNILKDSRNSVTRKQGKKTIQIWQSQKKFKVQRNLKKDNMQKKFKQRQNENISNLTKMLEGAIRTVQQEAHQLVLLLKKIVKRVFRDGGFDNYKSRIINQLYKHSKLTDTCDDNFRHLPLKQCARIKVFDWLCK